MEVFHRRESVFNMQLSNWIEALKINTNVESVDVHFPDSEDTLWDGRKSAVLLQAMASLPSLTVLRVFLCRQRTQGGDDRASLLAITSAVETARQLRHFEILNMTTTDGDQEYVRGLIHAIQNHGQLRSLKFTGTPQEESRVTAIIPVLQSRRITQLHLRWKPDAMLPLIEALRANTTLESLKLDFALQQPNHPNDNIVVALGVVTPSVVVGAEVPPAGVGLGVVTPPAVVGAEVPPAGVWLGVVTLAVVPQSSPGSQSSALPQPLTYQKNISLRISHSLTALS